MPSRRGHHPRRPDRAESFCPVAPLVRQADDGHITDRVVAVWRVLHILWAAGSVPGAADGTAVVT